MSLLWTLDPSGVLLDVSHSRRTTQKRQTKKLDIANSRGTTTHVARTSKFLRLTQSKYNKLTNQHCATSTIRTLC